MLELPGFCDGRIIGSLRSVDIHQRGVFAPRRCIGGAGDDFVATFQIEDTSVRGRIARLGDGVRVGPFCYIGADVEVGDGTTLGSHCSVHGPTRIGRDNRFVAHCAIGGEPQDKKYGGERVELVIGR